MRIFFSIFQATLVAITLSSSGYAEELLPTAIILAQAPLPLSPAGEGRRAYLKYNCSGCHGAGATGGMGPNIVHTEAGDVSEAVLEGEDEGMPSYRGIVTTTEINNIAAYLRSIGTPSEPKFNDWWVAVPKK
jgi:cytochrome c551